jgi:hypothetical protein
MKLFNKLSAISVVLLSLSASGCGIITANVGPQPMDRSVFPVLDDPEATKLAAMKSAAELFALWKNEAIVKGNPDSRATRKLGEALGINLRHKADDPVYQQIQAFALNNPALMPVLLPQIGTCGAVNIAVAMQQSGQEMIAKGNAAGYEMRDAAYRAFGDIRGAADPKIVSGCLRKAGW